ncbi:Protein disulfide-isomerase-like 2-2 [Allomyces javanicus]|nr:Protein disulfide-isomerase-like 2-2 [Allomyces javanicus]
MRFNLTDSQPLAAILVLVVLALVQAVSSTTFDDVRRFRFGWHKAPSDAISLTTSTFDDKIRSGTWYVPQEVAGDAPWSPHCEKLAPKYEELATMAISWRDEGDFYVARVNCVANEQLCDLAKLGGFPSAYNKGQQIEEVETWTDMGADLIKYAKRAMMRFPKVEANSV